MVQNSIFYADPMEYFFTRAKDTRIENGKTFITLFGRLTRETKARESRHLKRRTETAWTELEEIIWEQAGRNTRQLPDGIHTYQISEDIFIELYKKSILCPNELYYITPIYKLRKFKKFN